MENATDPFTISELADLIKSAKSGSAPGPDELSYEYFKLITSNQVLQVILKLLNLSLLHNLWPQENNEGTIILLLKKDSYNGNPQDLRPITLLQILRKLFTGMLTKRMADILYTNNILKGNNYGFAPGKSTNDVISIYKHAIDHSKLKKKSLFAVALDIEKAYDTVPEIAMILSLKRVGASAHLIKIILMLHNDRHLRVLTASGLTENFTPSTGLPQGDKISPLLWIIHYDPLLCQLDLSDRGYHFTQEIILNKLTFADDLTLLCDNIPSLQPQIDTVVSFLDMYGQRVNPTKTEVHSNLDPSALQILLDAQLNINGNNLEKIYGNNKLHRVLGAFFTMDGNDHQTIEHAMNQAQGLLSSIKRSYTPGPLASYLINVVLIPILAYRLQVASVKTTKLQKIDKLFRATIRKKYNYSYVSNSILYDKDFGINLNCFRSVLDQTQITNALLHQRNVNELGIIHRLMSSELTESLKLPP
jgi:Reverse transcriptase (RNA-dependent DNA polymerase)